MFNPYPDLTRRISATAVKTFSNYILGLVLSDILGLLTVQGPQSVNRPDTEEKKTACKLFQDRTCNF